MPSIGQPPYPSLARSLWDEWLLAGQRGFTNLGTYNPNSRLPSGEPSDHAVYPALAFDAGFSPAIGWQHREARRLFNDLVDRPGINYVILGDRIWSRERGLHEYEHGGHDNHLHASGLRGNYQAPPPPTTTLSQLWIDNGGEPELANIMAAIALAESGGRVDAIGGPNSDGTYDRGLWQINDIHGYNRRRLVRNPGYNARAAVDIQRSQGLDAWTVFRTGAYRQHMGQQGPAIPSGPGRRRPGGGSPDPGAADRRNAMIAWHDYINPLGPYGPLDTLGDLWGAAGKAVSGVDTFFHWIAWLFHPRNILRIVEFLAGAGLFFYGLGGAMRVFDAPGSSSSSSGGEGIKRYGRARRAAVRKSKVARAAARGPGAATAEAAREIRRARRARREQSAQNREGIPF